MKRIIFLIGLILCMVEMVEAFDFNEEAKQTDQQLLYADDDSNISFIDEYSHGPTMTITNDGKVLINDIEIEKLSVPEIVEQLKLIVEGIQRENYAWNDLCGRQTDNLLQELKTCQEEKQQSIEGWQKTINQYKDFTDKTETFVNDLKEQIKEILKLTK